jgi:uncharacterized protein YegP (UPF0339 family)
MGNSSTDNIRVHSEAPAEGDNSREYPEIRSHSQDPVEGADRAPETEDLKLRPVSPVETTNQAPVTRTSAARAGTFELLLTDPGDFEFRLLSPAGEVLAVSGVYSNRNSAIAGIRDARECAATALFKDHTTRLPSTTRPVKPGQQGPSRWFG